MNRCYLSLGSNQRNPERQIRQALKALKTLPRTRFIKSSSLHWTKAWGLMAQQDFCNAVVTVDTNLKPAALLKHCHIIESQQGRVRNKPWGPRTLDIDIIFYAKRVIRSKSLQIPHPYYKEREFVLKPLLEILECLDRVMS